MIVNLTSHFFDSLKSIHHDYVCDIKAHSPIVKTLFMIIVAYD